MKKYISVILLILVLCLSSCRVFSISSENPLMLPLNATNIQQVGNGWVIFNLGDKKFLFYREHYGHQGYQCITQIK